MRFKAFPDASVDYRPPPETSSAIILIRPLLIYFMMLAHLFALDSAAIMNAASPLTLNDWLAVFLKSTLAKSGVPLLSLVSGYLAVSSLHRYGFLRLLGRKARRLVWPLVWANLLFVILITWPAQAADPSHRPDLTIHPFNFYGWFQAIFAFYKLPANQPLFFLKDLFTCFLLLPLLLALARLRYVNVLVLFWMAWKCIYLQSAFLFEIYPLWFFRFDIVFAFYSGMLLFLNHRGLVIHSRWLNSALIAAFALTCGVASLVYVVLPQPDHAVLFLWLDFTVKVVSVVGCIALMSTLQGSGGLAARALRRLSPYSYTLFLTHAFTFTWFHQAFVKAFGWPQFFAPSGAVYVGGIFLCATLVAVGLRMAWMRLATAVSSSA